MSLDRARVLDIPVPVQPRQGEKMITNAIGMKLALIPAGEFLMGSPDTDRDALADEKPQHRVRITRPFCLGATAATPEETHCSATTTQALPQTSSVPTTAEAPHSRADGLGALVRKSR